LLEWARISCVGPIYFIGAVADNLSLHRLASTIYQLFVGSDNSSDIFYQLKRIHGLMPYFMIRGVLRISNPVAMIRNLLDLFLARPFGQTSLIQRMFSSGLNDEVRELKSDMEMVAQKIDSPVMVQKVKAFVTAPIEIQRVFKADAGKLYVFCPDVSWSISAG
jgi:hypothetical protein